MGFQLQCYRNLNSKLGFSDAIVEINEVALRELINSGKQFKFGSYIKKLSDTHGIIVDYSNSPDILNVKMAGSYLVTVYTEFELFLHEFKDDYNMLNNNKCDFKEKNGSKLEQIYEKYYPIFNYKRDLNFKIAEYYRLCRNKIIHSKFDSSLEKKLSKAYNDLQEFKEIIIDTFNIKDAPNEIKDLCFDDFILYTKVIKKIGKHLCELVEPSNQEDVILSLNLNKFKKFSNNESRFRQSVIGELRTVYGYKEEEAHFILNSVDISNIIRLLFK
ncbi:MULTISPECIES: hypothetical protein [Bacillus]|nr:MULTISPECIES: hypothetical protein [Bacillus]SLC13802.1 Uncharacterised protein [Mycobacteroides abscessus subsp. massiliense]ATU25872.1 hypothetical protein BMJ37_03620 [Bacillus velezensis]AUS18597.1 hypothetical protein C0W57_21780 [Bacillus velezensis]KAF1275094.1 hypothetical protein BUE72_14495 [Bacillus amyloliquefaciens]MBL3628360.1 hypothetical protein [Bacillus sp. RHF6]